MKKAAAFLLACLAAAQLCACAADPAQPVVTSDVLASQDSAVQTALEQSAGQDYAYYWEGEHIDEEIEYYAELYRQELEALRGGEDSLNNRQLTAYYESELENDCPSQREYLEEIAALDPPVSAQEAANIAGEYFEVLYGIDLSQQPIILRYIQGNDQWELLYKGWFIPPTTLHRLTVHLWQSDNQQRERRHICNGAWHGGKCPCPVLFTFPTNGNCFALFIGTVSFQIYDKGCNPNHCTEDIKNKLKHGVVICLIDNLKDYSNSPNYGTRSKNSYS